MLPLFDRNPTRKTPVITLGLIGINFAVFIYMLFLSGINSDIFVYRFSTIPWEIIHAGQIPLPILQRLFSYPVGSAPGKPVYLTLLTSMFLHDGWLHILGNMLFLWVFGNNIEDVMGHLPFLAFYLFCGVFGTLSHVAVYSQSFNPLLGASGAISGVLGAYLILYPRTYIFTWIIFFILPIPAYVVIGFWIVLQVVQGLTSAGMGGAGTAWFAHMGGLAMGLIITGALYPVLRRRRDELAKLPEHHYLQR